MLDLFITLFPLPDAALIRRQRQQVSVLTAPFADHYSGEIYVA